MTWLLEPVIGLPAITSSQQVRWMTFAMTAASAVILAIWSFRSLPPGERGKVLVNTGPFRYLRHPLYASFLSCSNFGLAVLFNNWIYILWALLLHPVWHWNIRSEEKLMQREFPEEYEKYCTTTGRFLPRIRRLKQDKPVQPTH